MARRQHIGERLRRKSMTHRFLACAVDGCLLISEGMNPGFQAEWEDFNFSFEHLEFDMRVLETFKAVGKKGKLKETEHHRPTLELKKRGYLNECK